MFRVTTINMIVLFAFAFFILLFIVILLWILIPALYGLPPVPTKPGRIQKALKLANLQPDETLYDLGAGDGRVLLIAARDFGAKEILVAGGVSANRALRQAFQSQDEFKVHIPAFSLCTDNAAMIAAAGYYRYALGHTSELAMDVQPTWPLS